jgi:hypothetical protein
MFNNEVIMNVGMCIVRSESGISDKYDRFYELQKLHHKALLKNRLIQSLKPI